jgi:hypothetical protein
MREPNFQTDHIYLAAFLISHGHDLVEVVGGEGGRLRFGFEDSSCVRSCAGDFMSGGLVEARKFSFELLKLKKLIPRQVIGTQTNRRARHAAFQRSFEDKT